MTRMQYTWLVESGETWTLAEREQRSKDTEEDSRSHEDDSSDESDWSDSPNSDIIDGLCSKCRRIDFRKALPVLARDTSSESSESSQGGQWSWEIDLFQKMLINRGVCQFCNFVVCMINRQRGNLLDIQMDQPALMCSVNVCYSGEANVVEDGVVVHYDLHRLEVKAKWPYEDEPRDQELWEAEIVNKLDFESSIMVQCNSQPRDHSLISLLPPHVRTPLYHPQLPLQWMRVCDQQHRCSSSAQTSNHNLLTDLETLRLVDVDERRMVYINHSHSVPEYCALSYVWGVKKQDVQLTLETFSVYSMPGRLPKLPQTIEDAMTVCRQIGYRYLWCDVLCILQDDEQDKSDQIRRLDKIFGLASLTIIDAGDGTVQDGLYGVSKDRKAQITSTFGQWTVVAAALQPNKTRFGVHLSCRWSKRAWTLQEVILSRRCLVFTTEQIYWVCHERQWLEDVGLEVSDEELEPDLEPNLQYRRFDIHTGPLRPDLEMYPRLVEAYMSRDLSREDDVEYAFAGILAAIGETCLFGIPVNGFEKYLCWIDARVWSERDAEEASLVRREGCPHLPSWSWMSWKGRVSYSQLADDECKALIRDINYSEDSILVTKHPFHQGQGAIPRTKTLTPSTLPDLSGQGIARDPGGLLSFRAEVGQFYLHRVSKKHVVEYALRLRPQSDTSKDSFEEDVVMDEEDSNRPVRLDIYANMLLPPSSLPLSTDSPYEFVALGYNASYGPLIVMLVSWHGKFARREATTELSKSYWKAAKPVERLITMI